MSDSRVIFPSQGVNREHITQPGGNQLKKTCRMNQEKFARRAFAFQIHPETPGSGAENAEAPGSLLLQVVHSQEAKRITMIRTKQSFNGFRLGSKGGRDGNHEERSDATRMICTYRAKETE